MSHLPLLALRAEAGPGIGAGHLARCLALAEAWVARTGSAVIGAPVVAPPWDRRIADAGVAVVAPDQLPESAAWFVADGYGLASVHADLRRRGRLLVVDDFGETGPTAADVVLDQNPGVAGDTYNAELRLCGPRYALLRRQLRDATVPPFQERVRRVALSFGGFPTTEVQRFSAALRASLASRDVDVVEMNGTMDPATIVPTVDVALSTAGTFLWELCRFGVPTVLVSTARNQALLARAAAGAGIALDAGQAELERVDDVRAVVSDLITDAGARRRLREHALETVDGLGADRVVTVLRAKELSVRPVVERDADLLLRWANDPLTRQASFDQHEIGVGEHRTWLEKRLRSADAAQFIAAGDREPIGLVRFDRVATGDEGWRAEIGVVVAPDHRGRGLAAALIEAGCQAVSAQWGHGTVLALIRPENVRSRAAFAAADFDLVDDEPVRAPTGGHDAVRYARRCDGR